MMSREQLAAIVDAELLNRYHRTPAERADRIMAAADEYRSTADPVVEMRRRELLAALDGGRR